MNGARPGDLTELQVEQAGEQISALFSYRQAKNIRDVGFVIQVSKDLVNWTALTQPVRLGGEDKGTYIKHTVKIPIPASDSRQFVRVKVHLAK